MKNNNNKKLKRDMIRRDDDINKKNLIETLLKLFLIIIQILDKNI